MYRKLLYSLSVALFFGLGTAQAQTTAAAPALTSLDRAGSALEAARQAGAPARAPDTLAIADAALAEAVQLAGKRRSRDAERAAAKALRYADLAASQARYIALKEAVDDKTARNARLRRELLLGNGADKP